VGSGSRAGAHQERNFLFGRHSDAANAAPAAVGYNFRRFAAWLRAIWCVWLMAVIIYGLDETCDVRIA
jgi:hypothetical protein